MAEIIHLYKRLTYRYADAYRHLDEDKYIGDAKLLAGRIVEESNDYDRGPTRVFRVVLKRGVNPVDARKAIHNSFSGSNCRHEWDCCGCPSYSADVRKVSDREFSVRQSVSYNY